jgi:hypothetical protein
VSRTLAPGARNGAVEGAVRASAQNLDQTKLTAAVSSTWVKGSDVTVTATYPYTIRLFGIPVTSGTLSSSTTERVE